MDRRTFIKSVSGAAGLLFAGKLIGMETMVIKPIIGGLSTLGLFKFGISGDTDSLRGFGLGAASVVGGSYASSFFLN